ncbi:hypothetical protein [Paraburkholderia tropica]|uniref:hypothetical protein n=1 Tax=Paraburkholderia tropica TaxID=92647 RepID=UPI003D2A14EE
MVEQPIFNVTISLCEPAYRNLHSIAHSIEATPIDVIHKLSNGPVDELIGNEILNLAVKIREGFQANLDQKVDRRKGNSTQSSAKFDRKLFNHEVASHINSYAFTPYIEDKILESLYKKLSVRERNFAKKITLKMEGLNICECEKVPLDIKKKY